MIGMSIYNNSLSIYERLLLYDFLHIYLLKGGEPVTRVTPAKYYEKNLVSYCLNKSFSN